MLDASSPGEVILYIISRDTGAKSRQSLLLRDLLVNPKEKSIDLLNATKTMSMAGTEISLT